MSFWIADRLRVVLTHDSKIILKVILEFMLVNYKSDWKSGKGSKQNHKFQSLGN